jgi:hypothetical protein
VTEICPLAFICSDGLVAIRFDVTAVPPGADIQQAFLFLSLTSGIGPNAEVKVGLAMDEWTEDSLGRPVCNFDESVSTEVSVTPGEYSWNLTDLVLSQHANPADNHGFCMMIEDDATRTFSSREGPNNLQPHLDITYK